MDLSNHRIIRIDWARLEGERPRRAGCNARLGEHGQRVAPALARLTTSDGATGFGWAWLSEEDARNLVGFVLEDALTPTFRVKEPLRALEYPVLDLAARLAGRPVYRLLNPEAPPSLRVPCYDTSLYFDDLHLAETAAAADLIAGEAAEGHGRGHRNFKIKVGRGAMHLPLTEGTARDVAIINAVRAAVGPDALLMIDANNGYNLNLTKEVLTATAGAGLYWIEEPFHEDAVLYRHLKRWLEDEDLAILVADGEGDASPRLLPWVQDGLVDVLQYDCHNPGLTRWLELGSTLALWAERDGCHAGAAPHNYGDPFGNYAVCHLAPALTTFEMAEWDEASVAGLDASGYAIRDGYVHIPNLPGFGLELDHDHYARAIETNGFTVVAE
ncbi:MAG: mandelate racemase [Anaerolineae bacterium]|nr:mandelate racemase [Anaerolineae bacterium]